MPTTTKLLAMVLPYLVLSIGGVQADSTQPSVVIQQTNPDYPAEKLAGPGVTVKPFDSSEPKSEQVADPKERNHWIHEAGLDDFVRGWDDFAKDELVIRAEIVALDTLRADYPKAEPGRLSKLRKIVKAERARN